MIAILAGTNNYLVVLEPIQLDFLRKLRLVISVPAAVSNEQFEKIAQVFPSALKLGAINPDPIILIHSVRYIFKQVIPIIVKVSTVMILLGLVCMYLGGEKSLTPSEKKKKITSKK